MNCHSPCFHKRLGLPAMRPDQSMVYLRFLETMLRICNPSRPLSRELFFAKIPPSWVAARSVEAIVASECSESSVRSYSCIAMRTLANLVLEWVLFGLCEPPAASIHGVCAGWHPDRIPSFVRVFPELTAGFLGIWLFTAASSPFRGPTFPRPTPLPCQFRD